MNNFIAWWNKNKSKVKGVIIFTILCILSFFGVYFFNTMKAKADYISLENNDEKTDIELKNVELDKSISSEVKTNLIKVDVKGAVKNPGVYEIEDDKRIIDVLKKAGGVTNSADTSIINLSKKLKDEMVLIIYTKEELKSIENIKELEAKKQEECLNLNKNIENNSCIEKETENTSNNKNLIININTASKEELETLPGIGESKANAIIEYREKNGLFKSIEDIKNVNGIGASVFDKIKENIKI